MVGAQNRCEGHLPSAVEVSVFQSVARACPTIGDAISASSESPSKPKRSNRELARTTGLVVLAVLMTLFAVFNLEKVEVSWIFGKGEAPLIVVIVLSVLVGVVFTHFAERRSAKRG